MRNVVTCLALPLLAAGLIAGTAATTRPGTRIDEKALARAAELVAQAKAYVREGKYDLAVQAAEEALNVGPSGVWPGGLRPEARAWKVIAESHEKLRKYPAPAIERMIEDVKAERPPAYARLIETADRITEWLDLCEGRGPTRPVLTEATLKRIREQLDKPVTLEFQETPFENTISFLMDLTGLNFEVDAEAKRRQRIDSDTTITLKMVNVSVKEALKAILSQVNLEYEIGPERIVLTDAQGLKRRYEVRVYDVRDLVHAMSGQPYIGFGMDNNNGPAKPNETAAAHLENLARLIRNATGKESWAETAPGSRASSIQTFREEMLIVVQTPQLHDRIRYLLTWLRAYLPPPEPKEKFGPGAPTRPAGETPAMRRVRELFETRLVNLEFPGTTFDNAVDFFMDLTGVTFLVDPEAVKRQRIGPETTVTLKLENVRLAQFLRAMLGPLSLDYTVTPAAVLITDAEGMPRAAATAERLRFGPPQPSRSSPPPATRRAP